MSVAPPAGNGTIRRTGLPGQACALTLTGSAIIMHAPSAATTDARNESAQGAHINRFVVDSMNQFPSSVVASASASVTFKSGTPPVASGSLA